MENQRYTILLADDHSILRAGLRSMLSSIPEFDVIGEVDNGKDAVHSAITLKPNLLITDISMPKTNGTEAVREIKRRTSDVKILVLTMHSSESHIFDALNSGADGYVLKEDDHTELLNAINSILAGKKYLSPSISNNIVNGYLNPQADSKCTSSWDLLTRREREIIKLIAEGYRSKDIAEYLSISIKTVEKHRTNLMKKLDLHSVSSLTTYAIQQGIVCD